ncbi:MAG: hypothetical protein KGI37_03260 [Alphaproteobacteria bacterium]|nr:hypothetical protein [Alphaproteobacteria bacterium]
MAQRLSTRKLSASIDADEAIDHLLARYYEGCDEECDATVTELIPEDIDFLPTPEEAYIAFRRAAQVLLADIENLTEKTRTRRAPTHGISARRVDTAQRLSVATHNAHNMLDVIRRLECDDLVAGALLYPITTRNTRGLGALKAQVKRIRSRAAYMADDNDDAPVFAHTATNAYYELAADLLKIAKPFCEDEPEQPWLHAPALFFLPDRTKRWINCWRERVGYPALS